MPHLFRRLVVLSGALALAACAASGRLPPTAETEVAALAATLRSLGPEVEPAEAERAARVAFSEARALALQYEVSDPPIIHNMKVNAGLRQRGLCWQWADDMEARLAEERFATLDLHRAVANLDTPRLDHSTLVVSRRGDPMEAGVVLDPWRGGGRLFWSRVPEDASYEWRPREVALGVATEAAPSTPARVVWPPPPAVAPASP